MLILMTNRDHTSPLPNDIEKVSTSFLSNQPGTVKPSRTDRNLFFRIVDKDGKASNVAKKKELMYYPYDKVNEIFTGVDPDEIKRQWVVYIHGHHQDPLENIKKIIEIERIHNVNVLAFSWPSHSYVTTGNRKAVYKVIKKAIKRYYKIVSWKAFIFNTVWGTGEALVEYWENYPHAKREAVESVNDLTAGLTLFKKKLYPGTSSADKPNLIVASLGNYLLEQTIRKKRSLPMSFKNIVLHEADANASLHSQWVPDLLDKCDRVSIIYNTDDSTLWASTVRNKSMANAPEDTNRLGMIQRGYIVDDNIYYIDLSRMPCLGEIMKCEHEHEFYIKDEDQLIDPPINLITALLHGENDFLPANKSTSKNEFSRMNTDIQLFMFEEIVMHADADNYDDDTFGEPGNRTNSLSSGFEDPLTPA